MTGSRDSLSVDDAALVKGHAHTEARLDQLGQYLELHLAHQLQVDLTQLFVPDDTQQRVLFLELPQAAEHGVRITAVRQTDAVAEHRLQHRRQCTCRCPQPHARRGMRQAGSPRPPFPARHAPQR